MNFTISVPAGASNHGNPNLICLPPQWYDYLVFYFSNYGAHAATVFAQPGQGWQEAAWTSIGALFLPTIGFSRGLGRFLGTPGDLRKHRGQPFRRAKISGAFCTVLKKPVSDIALASAGDFERGEGKKYSHSGQNDGAVVANGEAPEWWRGWRPPAVNANRKIHGIYVVPDGYEIVHVPKAFPLKARCARPKDMTDDEWVRKVAALDLPSNYNIPKVLIGLVQALWAITTIYRARGDQIDLYGYAAFGLTVVPYALMSMSNLFAALVCPEYPSMFFVSSPDLVRAIGDGGMFDSILADIDTSSGILESKKPSNMLYSYTFWKRWIVEAKSRNSHLGFVVALALGAAIFAFVWLLILSPLIVVGAVSRFRSSNSTTAQRGWTLTWLVGGIALPFVQGIATSRVDGLKERQLYVMLFRCLAAIPSIGGMVVVGLMIRDFGVCTLVG